jgi:hypothetical protein
METQEIDYTTRVEALRKDRDCLQTQLEEQKRLVQVYRDQIFEIAKIPNTVVTSNHNTNTNNRTLNILNQLAPYDLNTATVTQLVNDHFTEDIFRGGPDEIAKMTAQMILKDPGTQKPKVVCTDYSRKNFRYLVPEDVHPDSSSAQLQLDPGFQKTHRLIKRPLGEANLRVFIQQTDVDFHRDQWETNDKFISDCSEFSEKVIVHLV